jgi:hypothetical protein
MPAPEETERGPVPSGIEAYRTLMRQMIQSEVDKVLDDEILSAARELMEEQRKAIREATQQSKRIIQEVVEEEKLSIREKVDGFWRSLDTLGTG